MRLIIPTLFGLEGLVADELRYMKFENVEASNGKVSLEGDFAEVARANIRCRMGERVLIELGNFQATTFEELFQGVKSLPWEMWIAKTDAFPVKGWSLNSTLHSVPDCQSIIKKAVVDRLGGFYHQEWLEETGPTVQIQFSIMNDEVSVMLDSTGPGLHKRGYRANANEAPLRETLAAGLVDLAHVRTDSTVLDPMCGSGTILIEAAMKARGISPGLLRRFACEKWSCFPEEVFGAERQAAKALIRKKEDIAFEAIGYDLDPACVKLTRENAMKAHVGDMIRVSRQDVHLLRMSHRPVVAICNPPYGERLLDITQARELYTVLGSKFRPAEGHSYYIISSDPEFEEHFGRRADKKRKLYNGMIQCNCYMYYKMNKD